MSHLKPEMSKEKMNNVCSKYKALPDEYFREHVEEFIGPAKFAKAAPTFCLVADPSVRSPALCEPKVKIWELFSGSASLSNYVRSKQVSHLPPIDYRYGWNLADRNHQKLVLEALLTVGVSTLFASPNCAPWGANARSSPPEVRNAKRAEETITLQFLAVACFSRCC